MRSVVGGWQWGSVELSRARPPSVDSLGHLSHNSHPHLRPFVLKLRVCSDQSFLENYLTKLTSFQIWKFSVEQCWERRKKSQ